jgi:very-short-patch-repair endonuclease
MSLLENAKSLRRTMTDAEQKLWYHLRAYRFMGSFVGWISATHPPTCT